MYASRLLALSFGSSELYALLEDVYEKAIEARRRFLDHRPCSE
jgi:hypothetical protein